MLKIKLFSFIAIFFLSLNFMPLWSMDAPLERIDRSPEANTVTDDSEEIETLAISRPTENPQLIWDHLQVAAELEEKAGGSDNPHLKIPFLKQFSPAVVKKFIESLALRREKKELHALFQFNDVDLPIELAGLAQSIHDEALVDACAFAFATAFVQPALCQKIDGAVLIKKISALSANFEQFKKKAAFYVKHRMWRPLRVSEYEGEASCFLKFNPDGSLIAFDKAARGNKSKRSIVVASAISGKVLHEFEKPEFNFSQEKRPIIRFNGNRNILICCTPEPQMIYIWDLNSGTLLHALKPQEMFHSKKVEIVDIESSQSGNRLIIEMDITKETEGEKSVASKICLWDLTSNRSLGLFRGYHYGNNRIIHGYNPAFNVCVFRDRNPEEYGAFDTETGTALPIYLSPRLLMYYGDSLMREEKSLTRKMYCYPGDIENEKEFYFEIVNNKQESPLGFVEKKHPDFSSRRRSLGKVVKIDLKRNMLIVHPRENEQPSGSDRYYEHYKNALEVWKNDEMQDISLKYTLSDVDEEGKTDFFTGKFVGDGLLCTTSGKTFESRTHILWDLAAKKRLNKWSFDNSRAFISDKKGEKFLLHTLYPDGCSYPIAGKQIFEIWYAYQVQDLQEKLKALSTTLENAPLEVILYVFLYTQILSSQVTDIDTVPFALTDDQRAHMEEIRAAHKQMNDASCVKEADKLKKNHDCVAQLCAECITSRDDIKKTYRSEKTFLRLVKEYGYSKGVLAAPLDGHFPVYGTRKLPLIFHAAAFGKVEICQKLVKMGANPVAPVEGITPYLCALAANNKDVVNFFYSANQKALNDAIDRNDRDQLRLLLEQNVSITPFHIRKAFNNWLMRLSQCYYEIVVLLLNHVIEQGNLDQILTQNELGNFGKYGIRALPLTHHACAVGLPEAYQLLIALGADSARKVDGISARDCDSTGQIESFALLTTALHASQIIADLEKIEYSPFKEIIKTIKRLNLQALMKYLKLD